MLKKQNKGFTLLELLVVSAMLMIIATFFLVRLSGSQDSARDTKRRSDIKNYQVALENYAIKNDFVYPVANGSELTALCGSGRPLGDLSCPDDPRSPTYRYRIFSDGDSYVLWARLEKPNTPITYFVVCSTGEVGDSTVQPNSANCPL